MPWVLGEYLNINSVTHDHEFIVRWFDSDTAAQQWARGFNSPGTMMKCVRLPGGGRTTHPAESWTRVRPLIQLHLHDGISPSIPAASGFRWLDESHNFAHNSEIPINVRNWQVHRDGSMNHNCNPSRTWRTGSPFTGRVRPYNRAIGELHCSTCGAHVTASWLRTRAFNIATGRG